MFNRKKREIERLEEALSRQKVEYHKEVSQSAYYKKQSEAFLDEKEKISKQLTDVVLERNVLFEENERLLRKNGAIKRDLAAEIRQKQELSDLLDAERKAHPVCPSDCVKHDKPGPGASACRNCTRNPHAVDKYQKEETA